MGQQPTSAIHQSIARSARRRVSGEVTCRKTSGDYSPQKNEPSQALDQGPSPLPEGRHLCLEGFARGRLRRRTPGPPPFSAMNSTQAHSEAPARKR